MSKNWRTYLKSLAVASAIEIVVLIFTLYPMMDGFMVHSAIAGAQRPILVQFLNWFGIVFHLPSIILTFWFLPLAPVMQVFILSLPIYLRLKFSEGFSEKMPTIYDER
jgi:hypothetical protein